MSSLVFLFSFSVRNKFLCPYIEWNADVMPPGLRNTLEQLRHAMVFVEYNLLLEMRQWEEYWIDIWSCLTIMYGIDDDWIREKSSLLPKVNISVRAFNLRGTKKLYPKSRSKGRNIAIISTKCQLFVVNSHFQLSNKLFILMLTIDKSRKERVAERRNSWRVKKMEMKMKKIRNYSSRWWRWWIYYARLADIVRGNKLGLGSIFHRTNFVYIWYS